MRFDRLILVIIVGILLTGCRSHKRVVHGSDGIEQETIVVAPPHYTGPADNEVTSALLQEAYSWIGTPYKYGGKDKKGADCSGFVMVVFQKALSIDLPRVSRDQGEYCVRIDKKDLFPGDLVFFVTGAPGRVSHVGIYVGDGKMIHASSSKGVIITDITQKYYVEHLHHYGRVAQYFERLKGAKTKK